MRRRTGTIAALALALCVFTPAPASANLLNGSCRLARTTVAPQSLANACQAVVRPDSVWGIVKKAGGIVKKVITAPISGAAGAVAGIGLSAIVSWVLGGAGSALHETATLLGKTTTPDLGEPWFKSTYVHIGAIATLLTLPFLFAAAVQALMRSDLAMLVRATFGYLPLAVISIVVASRVTTLLLEASDSVSHAIERAAGGAATAFLVKTSTSLGGLGAIDGSPFVAFLVGFFVVAGALVLWLELLLREVAVYVIVLSLPLVFAAFVWPARRVWAIRAVEMLVALILSKIAMVAVLALGAGALKHAAASSSIVSLFSGVALVTLGIFSPWALVKLMPLGELAAGAASPLRPELARAKQFAGGIASPWADAGTDWAADIVSRMRDQATSTGPTSGQGAEAEAARMTDLGSETGSRETASTTDGDQGVTGGESTDPLRGTAGAPGGQMAGAPGEAGAPGAPGAPPDPAQGGAEHQQASGAELGPSPRFEGFEGAEALYQHPANPPMWTGPPDQSPPPPEDDDARPPTQDPEDGRL
ncbi:MAG TPA: hypothetical protein VIJ20_04680 [Solirubrobacteraceae bacterium]